MALPEILAASDLDVLWVVGANPLSRRKLEARNAFIVVQEMFLTETALAADVVLPATSAYEKTGTATNVCGEVQKLRSALQTVGVKQDLKIFELIAKHMGVCLCPSTPEGIFDEICNVVPGYNVETSVVAIGGAVQTTPVNGTLSVASRPELIESAGDTLFTSGTLGRYSEKLGSVLEAPGRLYGPAN
jgi:NADH-quinone oxidoreductase subunit G